MAAFARHHEMTGDAGPPIIVSHGTLDNPILHSTTPHPVVAQGHEMMELSDEALRTLHG